MFGRLISPSGLQGRGLHRHGLVLIQRHGPSKDGHWVPRVRYLAGWCVLVPVVRIARSRREEKSRGGERREKPKARWRSGRRQFIGRPRGAPWTPLCGKISRILGGSRPVHGVRPRGSLVSLVQVHVNVVHWGEQRGARWRKACAGPQVGLCVEGSGDLAPKQTRGGQSLPRCTYLRLVLSFWR